MKLYTSIRTKKSIWKQNPQEVLVTWTSSLENLFLRTRSREKENEDKKPSLKAVWNDAQGQTIRTKQIEPNHFCGYFSFPLSRSIKCVIRKLGQFKCFVACHSFFFIVFPKSRRQTDPGLFPVLCRAELCNRYTGGVSEDSIARCNSCSKSADITRRGGEIRGTWPFLWCYIHTCVSRFRCGDGFMGWWRNRIVPIKILNYPTARSGSKNSLYAGFVPYFGILLKSSAVCLAPCWKKDVVQWVFFEKCVGRLDVRRK